MTFGEQIVEQCGARAANVQHASGGWRKPGNDCHRLNFDRGFKLLG